MKEDDSLEDHVGINETLEQRQDRIESQRLADHQRRANETSEERHRRLQSRRLHGSRNSFGMMEFHTFRLKYKYLSVYYVP